MFSEAEVRLLVRCAHALMASPEGNKHEALVFLTCAAEAGDVGSQYRLGLWLARMDATGKRTTALPGSANYKEAIAWLTRAGEQGCAPAWYAVSRIYLKSEFSLRSLDEAYRYLAKAAEAGHDLAQCALGSWIWRTRNGDPRKDVPALYWLSKAQAQGCAAAAPLLDKLASRAMPAVWALEAQRKMSSEAFKVPQVLLLRVALAARFGLSIPEALLVDPARIDLGHCLEIDIRGQYARGKRRLIVLQTPEERQALDDILRQLSGVDCSAEGPEGNYRQRLYRLKKLMPDIDS